MYREDLSGGDFECRKQRRRTMPLVVVALARQGTPVGQLEIALCPLATTSFQHLAIVPSKANFSCFGNHSNLESRLTVQEKWVLETAIVIVDLTTSALLFAQFSIVHRSALLVLASGYLFTALIVIPHALTFPGAFSPTGLLGAGSQSSAWLYIWWKVSLPAAVIAYVLLKDVDSRTSISQRSPVALIGWSIAVVIGLSCGLT